MGSELVSIVVSMSMVKSKIRIKTYNGRIIAKNTRRAQTPSEQTLVLTLAVFVECVTA